MKVFVTVGTTSFDKLIETLDTKDVLQSLENLGYDRLVCQVGRGIYHPSGKQSSVTVEYYKYKDSLHHDIEMADLVISHAGAGTCLDVLAAGKPLLVVINEDLMNNHQIELASKLAEDGHLYYCTCRTLRETLESMDTASLLPFEPGQPQKFSAFLNNLFGVS